MAEFPLRGQRVWVAGEAGLVGRALVRALERMDVHLLSAPRRVLDLTDQQATYGWIARHKPDVVFVAAAKVGGIGANMSFPAEFIRDNLAIAHNVIEGSHRAGVPRLLFLGSSCVYPRNAPQPIAGEALLSGPLEESNRAYAVAKIAGLEMCRFYKQQYGRSYISAMPTNLYGPYDRFDVHDSHVIPAMMLKFHEARARGGDVGLWGTGTALREFLHVDDLAQALILMAERYDGDVPLNIGSGEEVSIARLAEMLRAVTGFQGMVMFDPSKTDGTPRKCLESSNIRGLGWAPAITLQQGLHETYAWFCDNPDWKRSDAA